MFPHNFKVVPPGGTAGTCGPALQRPPQDNSSHLILVEPVFSGALWHLLDGPRVTSFKYLWSWQGKTLQMSTWKLWHQLSRKGMDQGTANDSKHHSLCQEHLSVSSLPSVILYPPAKLLLQIAGPFLLNCIRTFIIPNPDSFCFYCSFVWLFCEPGGTYVPPHKCGGQRTTHGDGLSPSTTGLQGSNSVCKAWQQALSHLTSHVTLAFHIWFLTKL